MGKSRAQLVHFLSHAIRRIERVGIGELKDSQVGARQPVHRVRHIDVASSDFRPANVLHAHDAAIGSVLDDDVGELRGLGQPAQRGERNLRRLAVDGRFLPDLPGGDLVILSANRIDDILGVEIHPGELFGIDPDSHAVVFGSEGDHIADSFDAQLAHP